MTRVALRGLKGRLISSSVDAYVLSLETANRLSVRYRIEGFCFLLVNAWELLLKSRIIELHGKDRIFLPKKPRQNRETLTLDTCINLVYARQDDPVRCNLVKVSEFRNKAVHLVFGEVTSEVMSLFQSCVINYHNALTAWFGISLSDVVPAGMMTVVYDRSPDNFDLTSKMLRVRLGTEAVEFLSRFQAEIQAERQSLGHPIEFSSVVNYSLSSIHNRNKADVLVSSDSNGSPIGFVPVPKDSSLTHPLRAKECREKINERLAGRYTFNSHDMKCICAVHDNAKLKNFYYRNTITNVPQYNSAFVDWVVGEFERDSGFFATTRLAYRSRGVVT
ncbi:DUF3644 domain-containing protein [soil metagenome]